MRVNQLNQEALYKGASAAFLLVGDTDGNLWAFPRAHMISQEMPTSGMLVFNFGTHRVTIFSRDSRTDLLDWVKCNFEILAVPEFKPQMSFVRRVQKIVIEVKS